MGISMIGQLRKLRYLKGLARMVLEVTQIAELKVSLGKFTIRISHCQARFTQCYNCRARVKGGPQIWWILLLVLLITSARLCLQHSRNLGPPVSRALYTEPRPRQCPNTRKNLPGPPRPRLWPRPRPRGGTTSRHNKHLITNAMLNFANRAKESGFTVRRDSERKCDYNLCNFNFIFKQIRVLRQFEHVVDGGLHEVGDPAEHRRQRSARRRQAGAGRDGITC